MVIRVQDRSSSRGSSGTIARAAVRTGEATVLLLAAAAAQRWMPMPKWSPTLGEAGPVPAEWAGLAEAMPARAGTLPERRVTAAVMRASRVLPFTPTCLAQATAAQVMLRRRGAPGTVIVGLRSAKGGTGPRSRGRWEVHAWLMGSAGALTGGAAAEGFTAATAFSVPDSLPRRSRDADSAERT